MSDIEILIHVLEASVKRQGEKPLTNAYLLNIAKMAYRAKLRHEELHEEAMTIAYNESVGDERKWGSD